MMTSQIDNVEMALVGPATVNQLEEVGDDSQIFLIFKDDTPE
jgi:hypothetical protein